MAIGTYSELKTALATFANNTDATTMADDLLDLAEAELFDDLLPRTFESEESITLTLGQNYVALPSGYISPIALWLIIDSERTDPLQKVLPEQLPYYTDNSIPKFYAIDGANIRFDVPAASGYSGKFRMVKSSALSGSNTTNSLLTRRPDVYLAACMVQWAIYHRDPELQAVWSAKLAKEKASFKAAENRSRDVTLRTEFAGSGRSNILRGE